MSRRPSTLDLARLPALLVAVASSWVQADEPFPFPAPPLRSRSSVYITPDVLPALPSATRPVATSSQRLTPSSGTKTAQAADAAPAPRGGLVPPARKSVIADASETERRVERLKLQLEELNDLLSRPPVEPPVIERAFTTPLPSAVEHEPEPAIQHHVAPQLPVQSGPPTHEPERERPDPPEAEPGNGKLSATGLIKGLPVAAIDRVHVADNLFAAAEYVLANEIYEQVDRKSISVDESGWVEFQLANCSRRLGRIDDAKKRYRRVVSDPTLGWLQDMAKWRLDAIDEREQLIKEHSRLEAAIQQFSEVPRAAAKP